MAPRTLSLLGHQQGHDGDLDLRPPHHPGRGVGPVPRRAWRSCCKGEDGFYERIFEDLKAAAPARALGDRRDARPLRPRRQRRGGREAGAACCSSSTPTACAATSWPTSTRSTATRAPHRDLDPATYGLTLWDLDREFITERPRRARTAPPCARSWRSCATPTAAPSASSTCTSPTPSARTGCRTAWSRRATSRRSTPPSARRVLEKLVEAESFERFLHAKYVGHKRFSLEGCEALIPLLDRVLNDAARDGRAARP